MHIQVILEELVRKGITVELCYDRENDMFYYNVNPGTKSHMYLVYNMDKDLIEIHGRYGDFDTISLDHDQSDSVDFVDDVITELCWKVKSYMCGRDYVNCNWADLMVEKGVLTKYTETITTYR